MFPSYLEPDSNPKKWAKKWSKALSDYGGNNDSTDERIIDMENKWLGYFGKLRPNALEYITKIYGIRTPARVTGYPVLFNVVEELIGEASKDSLEMSVEGIDDDIKSRKLNNKVTMAVEMITRPIRKIIGAEYSIDLISSEEKQQQVPEDIKQFMEMDFHDHTEKAMMVAMKYLQNTYHLDDIFQDGLRKHLVLREQIYHVGVDIDDPLPRVVEPSRFDYGRSPSAKTIQHSPWAREWDDMALSDVVNEFGHLMDAKMLKDLDTYFKGDDIELPSEYKKHLVTNNRSTTPLVRVIRYEWMSVKMLNVKTSENAYDENRPFQKIVDDPSKADKKYPYNSVWQGVSFMGKTFEWRKPNQTRDWKNKAKTQLSYFGLIKKGPSLVDRLYNLYLFYCITMYHIEATLNRAGGKAVVYDVAQKPEGVDTGDVFYNAKEGGLILINTATDKALRSRNFNQFQQIDFTLSQTINQLFDLKSNLEQTIMRMAGTNDSRMGVASPEETKANNQQKIIQSNFMTQSLFDEHFRIIEDVMNEIINMLCITWRDKDERLLTIFGDKTFETFKFLSSNLKHQYGLSIQNSQREKARKDFIMNEMAKMGAGGHVASLQMLQTYNAATSKDAEAILKRTVAKLQEMQAAQAQAQQVAGQEERALKKAEIDSRIMAARIEAAAYVETKQLEIESKERIALGKDSTDITKGINDAQSRMDQIMAKANADQQMANQQSLNPNQADPMMGQGQQQMGQNQPPEQQLM